MRAASPAEAPRPWSSAARFALLWAMFLLPGNTAGGAVAVDRTNFPTVTDMVGLKTIDSLSLSPDGRTVAYRLVSPSVADNRITVRYYVVPIDGSAPPRPVSTASDPIFFPLFDMIQNNPGIWAPDSRSIFALISSASQIQIHRFGLEGLERAVTADDADIISFALDTDGRGLSYQTRNARAEIDRAEAESELDGITLDPSVVTEGWPLTHNFAIGARLTTMREQRDGSVEEAASGPLQSHHLVLDGPVGSLTRQPEYQNPVPLQPDALGTSTSFVAPSGMTISLRAMQSPMLGLESYQVFTQEPGKPSHPCPAFFCRGFDTALREVGWDGRSGEIVILYEAGSTRRSTLYAWNPLTGSSRQIHASNGSIGGGAQYVGSPCAYARTAIICVDAAPDRPPRLERIDLQTGQPHILADPNVALSSMKMGRIKRLEWTDEDHFSNNGILVLPDGPAINLPLVITTSSCRGFLWGGSEPLAPEHVLASLGIASLCVNDNPGAGLERGPDGKPIPLALHKAALASFKAIIAQLSAQGVIDPARIGITGHSFGAMIVAYAISHSNLFHAAVMGTGVTTDPNSFFLKAANPASIERHGFSVMNLPPPDADPDHVWKRESAALNAASIKAPLLLLPPESEYLMALQLYGSILDAGGTAKMIVYPGESHLVSRQPRHQLSRETNSMDWLVHWLSK